MTRKLFIVARDQTALYGQLRRTVGREADVAIIYDRRPVARKPGKLARAVRPLKKLFRRGRPENILDALDRRQRTQIDAEIKTKGFAVVHLETAGSAPPRASVQPEPAAVVVEFNGRLPVVQEEPEGDQGVSSARADVEKSLPNSSLR